MQTKILRFARNSLRFVPKAMASQHTTFTKTWVHVDVFAHYVNKTSTLQFTNFNLTQIWQLRDHQAKYIKNNLKNLEPNNHSIENHNLITNVNLTFNHNHVTKQFSIFGLLIRIVIHPAFTKDYIHCSWNLQSPQYSNKQLSNIDKRQVCAKLVHTV